MTLIWMSACVGPHRSYYPQTQTYHEENLTINRTVSLEDVRIVGYNRSGRQRTVNLIQDQEEEFANNIRKAIVDNFHRNRLFALTHENDSTSHIISSVEIQDLKLLNKLNTFGKVWVYTALPAYAYGLWATMTVAKNGRYGSLSSTDKALLFSSLGSLLWVTTPLLFNTGSTEISFTLLLKNYERGSGQLVGTYRSDYMFKQKHRGGDTKKNVVAEIDDAFDETLRIVRQKIRQDAALYSAR